MARHAVGLAGILLAASVGSQATAAPHPSELERRASPPRAIAALAGQLPGHRPPVTATRLAKMDFDARVAEVQRMLRRRGFQTGAVDGKLGRRTRDAIRAYQSLVRAKGAPIPGPAATLAREKGLPQPSATPTHAD